MGFASISGSGGRFGTKLGGDLVSSYPASTYWLILAPEKEALLAPDPPADSYMTADVTLFWNDTVTRNKVTVSLDQASGPNVAIFVREGNSWPIETLFPAFASPSALGRIEIQATSGDPLHKFYGVITADTGGIIPLCVLEH